MGSRIRKPAAAPSSPRAEEIRRRRQALRLSQRRLAQLAGLPNWRVPWTEMGLRPDYSDEEYEALKEALARYERAQREAEKVLSR